jgi:hypothetical protein
VLKRCKDVAGNAAESQGASGLPSCGLKKSNDPAGRLAWCRTSLTTRVLPAGAGVGVCDCSDTHWQTPGTGVDPGGIAVRDWQHEHRGFASSAQQPEARARWQHPAWRPCVGEFDEQCLLPCWLAFSQPHVSGIAVWMGSSAAASQTRAFETGRAWKRIIALQRRPPRSIIAPLRRYASGSTLCSLRTIPWAEGLGNFRETGKLSICLRRTPVAQPNLSGSNGRFRKTG